MWRFLRIVAYGSGILILYFAFILGREYSKAEARRAEYGTNSAEVRAGLQDAARNLSLKTPFMIDSTTRLDAVEAEGDRLHYRYSFPDLSADSIDRIQLQTRTRALLIEKACSSAKLRFTLRYGARYVHTYFDRDRQPIAEIEIDRSVCGDGI